MAGRDDEGGFYDDSVYWPGSSGLNFTPNLAESNANLAAGYRANVAAAAGNYQSQLAAQNALALANLQGRYQLGLANQQAFNRYGALSSLLSAFGLNLPTARLAQGQRTGGLVNVGGTGAYARGGSNIQFSENAGGFMPGGLTFSGQSSITPGSLLDYSSGGYQPTGTNELDPGQQALLASIEQRGSEAQGRLASEAARRGLYRGGTALAASALQQGETEAQVARARGEFAESAAQRAAQRAMSERLQRLQGLYGLINSIVGSA